MSTPSPAPAPGRRTGGSRRVDLTTVLAVLLPLVAVLLAWGVHADATAPGSTPPARAELDRATVACPTATSDATTAVASLAGQSGRLAASTPSGDPSALDHAPFAVRPDTPVSPPGDASSPLVVDGTGALAPGLVAGRFATPLAAADCRAPAADQWFTGVGSGARHDSVVELTNPDGGQALVDVTVLGRDGPVDVPRLRGVVVKGGQTVSLDLGRLVPRRYDLTVRVATLRGRVLASLADSFDEIGSPRATADWLPAQSAPSTTNLLFGLPEGRGQRVLELANPGDSEARAQVQLITPQSTFTPEGARDVVVPPGSSVRVSLAGILGPTGTAGAKAAQAPLGLAVTSTLGLTASLFQVVDGDLVRSAPQTPGTDPAAAVLPALAPAGATGKTGKPGKSGKPGTSGTAELLLAGATGAGTVTVRAYAADGTATTTELDVEAGRAYTQQLPADARLVVVEPQGTGIAASVLLTASGGGATGPTSAAVVVVRPPLTSGLVPAVRPGTS